MYGTFTDKLAPKISESSVSHWGLFRNSTQEASVAKWGITDDSWIEWMMPQKWHKWLMKHGKFEKLNICSFSKLATWRSLFRRWCAPQLCWLATEPIFCRKSTGSADWPNKRRCKIDDETPYVRGQPFCNLYASRECWRSRCHCRISGKPQVHSSPFNSLNFQNASHVSDTKLQIQHFPVKLQWKKLQGMSCFEIAAGRLLKRRFCFFVVTGTVELPWSIF